MSWEPSWRQHARVVARWIDSLPAGGVERQAIVAHPDPTFDGDGWKRSHSDRHVVEGGPQDCGCLVGEVCLVLTRGEYAMPTELYLYNIIIDELAWERAGLCFPRLTARFGPERVWAWVKRRAARRVT